MLALQIIGIVHCAIIVDLFFSSLLENLQDSSLVLRFSSRETVTRVYRGGRSPSTFSPEEIGGWWWVVDLRVSLGSRTVSDLALRSAVSGCA